MSVSPEPPNQCCKKAAGLLKFNQSVCGRISGQQRPPMIETGLLTIVMRPPMADTGLLNGRDGSTYFCHGTTHGRQVYLSLLPDHPWYRWVCVPLRPDYSPPMVETGLLNGRDGSIYLCHETTHGRDRST